MIQSCVPVQGNNPRNSPNSCIRNGNGMIYDEGFDENANYLQDKCFHILRRWVFKHAAKLSNRCLSGLQFEHSLQGREYQLR